jgi:hypothetical protein
MELGGGWRLCYVFFLKKYCDAEFSRKNYFCKQNARKKYSDARFSPIKIEFFDCRIETIAPLSN